MKEKKRGENRREERKRTGENVSTAANITHPRPSPYSANTVEKTKILSYCNVSKVYFNLEMKPKQHMKTHLPTVSACTVKMPLHVHI